jgi:IclR family acetate operon transcriptional repressor
VVAPVESVDRALRVLVLLSQRGEGWTLEGLADASGIPKSSLHRVLGALRHRGFATQPEPSGNYLLGPAALEIAFGFHERLDVRVLARPLLSELVERYDETVHLAVLGHGEVVYVDKREGTHSVRMSSAIGGRNPAYCTGVGKALLAALLPDDESVRAWVERHGPLVALTPSTATTAGELAGRLAQTRSRGYAVDLGENEPGVHCVAVPLVFGGRAPVAAVSVTAPATRLPRSRLEGLGREVRDLVRDLVPAGGVAGGPVTPPGRRPAQRRPAQPRPTRRRSTQHRLTQG